MSHPAESGMRIVERQGERGGVDGVVERAVTRAMERSQDAIEQALSRPDVARALAGVQEPPLSVRDPVLATDILRAEINGLKKEIGDLTSQLTNGTTEARESAIDRQIEAATDRLEALQAQLDQIVTGQPVVAVVPPPPPFPGEIPQQAVNVSIWFMLTCGVTIIAVALIRALSRRSHAAAPQSDPRLDRIEEAIDAVAIEVERVSEGQRFTNRIIGELRALPAPNALEAWPAAAVRDAVPVRHQAGDNS